MRSIIIIFVLFGGNLRTLSGQTAGSQELKDLLNSPVIRVDNPVIKNMSAISQIQDDNTRILLQQQNGTDNNSIIVSQEGTQNNSYIIQSGSEMQTLLQQFNSNNDAKLQSVGKNIKITVFQSGDGNQINSYIENHGPQTRLAEFTQEGNFNKINLSLRGDGFTNSAPEQRMEINQYGNSHELNAFMDPFSAPLEINQTPGLNGEGMKIDVNTSLFNFPMKK
jgi:hypothetical protein